MGMILALQQGKIDPKNVSSKIKQMAKTISPKAVADFASTSHNQLKEDHTILKNMLLSELDRMEAAPGTFEDDPMQFILDTYPSLTKVLTYLMTPSFKEYITGIYIIAPKPTTFKIVLHNNQAFFLQFLGDVYQATVFGKTYYLKSIAEKERCILAIARLLKFGNPLKPATIPEPDKEVTSTKPEEDETPTEPKEKETPTDDIKENLNEDTVLIEVKAEKFEQIAVDLWNIIVENKPLPTQYSEYKDLYESLAGQIKSLKKNHLTKFSGTKIPTSPFWTEASGGKKVDEPKTDIISDDSALKISVKKGPSQLMSAEKKEATATFLSVAQSTGLSAEAQQKVLEILNNFAASTKTDMLNVTELKKADTKTLSKANKQAKKIYENALEYHKKIQTYLKSLFENNSDFKWEFISEAASGAIKFNNSQGTANYILAISEDGNTTVLKKMDDAVTSMLGKINVGATMKSGSFKIGGKKAGYRFYTALRANLQDIIKENNNVNEAYSNYKSASKLLLEDETNDASKSLFQKAKDGIYSALKFLWSKLVGFFNWITTAIQNLIEAVSLGFMSALEALDIEPDVNSEVYLGTYDFM